MVIEPAVFEDPRGYFFECYSKKIFEGENILTDFVQDNQSCSQKDLLRGIHFQKPPDAQAKLVRVLEGAALDVAVDIRSGSPTYGQYYSIELSGKNKKMLFIPRGFAHGFLTLRDTTVFHYKCDQFYNKSAEVSIQWNDPDLNIQWGITNPIVSEKDKQGITFRGMPSYFEK